MQPEYPCTGESESYTEYLWWYPAVGEPPEGWEPINGVVCCFHEAYPALGCSVLLKRTVNENEGSK